MEQKQKKMAREKLKTKQMLFSFNVIKRLSLNVPSE